MAFDLPTSFLEVWQAIRDGIKGRTITVNAQTLPLADGFFNKGPELRNPENEARFPGLVLRTYAPTQGDLVVNEKVKQVVTVTAEPCYLEASLPSTLALADGQTLRLMVGTEGPPETTVQAEQVVVFTAGQFANIAAATPAEVAAAVAAGLTGVSAALLPDGVTLRVTHGQASAWASLQVVGGTAAALVALFPDYQVWGRSAGDEVAYFDPPVFYDFQFDVVSKAARFDHHLLCQQVVEALYRVIPSPNQRAITLVGKRYEVRRDEVIDDPVPSAGEFYTTTTFVLRNVPFLRTDTVQPFNGGNPGVGAPGAGPDIQFPVIEEFVLRVARAAYWEDHRNMPDSEFEVVVEPAP